MEHSSPGGACDRSCRRPLSAPAQSQPHLVNGNLPPPWRPSAAAPHPSLHPSGTRPRPRRPPPRPAAAAARRPCRRRRRPRAAGRPCAACACWQRSGGPGTPLRNTWTCCCRGETQSRRSLRGTRSGAHVAGRGAANMRMMRKVATRRLPPWRCGRCSCHARARTCSCPRAPTRLPVTPVQAQLSLVDGLQSGHASWSL